MNGQSPAREAKTRKSRQSIRPRRKPHDLRATTDLRSVFKSVLLDHLGLDEAFVEAVVFPDSAATKPLADLVRS